MIKIPKILDIIDINIINIDINNYNNSNYNFSMILGAIQIGQNKIIV